jgi:hypothetical protein
MELSNKSVANAIKAMRPISHVGDKQLGIGIPNQSVWHDMSRKLNGLDALTLELLVDLWNVPSGGEQTAEFRN